MQIIPPDSDDNYSASDEYEQESAPQTKSDKQEVSDYSDEDGQIEIPTPSDTSSEHNQPEAEDLAATSGRHLIANSDYEAATDEFEEIGDSEHTLN